MNFAERGFENVALAPLTAAEDFRRANKYTEIIQKRRADREPAKVFEATSQNAIEIASMVAAGGVIVIPWGKEQRRILCLIGSCDNEETTKLMNRAKGRSDDQPLAIGCLPAVVNSVAEIFQSIPLKRAAVKRGKGVTEVLHASFSQSLGLILPAKDNIPQAVKGKGENGDTVLVVGEHDYLDKEDFYTETLHELHVRFGKVVAGTSANPTGFNVFSIFDQDKAFDVLKFEVDGFVKLDTLPKVDTSDWHLTSSTIMDLTGQYPIVTRWGNMHPLRFTHLFPDLVIPEGIPVNENAELKLV